MKIEIKNTKEEVIDWSKPQLVENKKSGDVVKTNGICSDFHFEGTSLKTWVNYGGRLKSSFKPFHGTVTLSND